MIETNNLLFSPFIISEQNRSDIAKRLRFFFFFIEDEAVSAPRPNHVCKFIRSISSQTRCINTAQLELAGGAECRVSQWRLWELPLISDCVACRLAVLKGKRNFFSIFFCLKIWKKIVIDKLSNWKHIWSLNGTSCSMCFLYFKKQLEPIIATASVKRKLALFSSSLAWLLISGKQLISFLIWTGRQRLSFFFFNFSTSKMAELSLRVKKTEKAWWALFVCVAHAEKD